MLRVLCCADGNSSTIRRIAISQFVLYTVLIGLSVFGSVYYKDELTHKEDEPVTIFTDRLYLVLGILHVFPLLLAIVLYVGIMTEKYHYLRCYSIIKIFESIINTLIFLSICILYALEVELYFAALLCVAPIFIGVWSLESVVIVNEYYNKKLRLPLEIAQKFTEIAATRNRLKKVVTDNNDSTSICSKDTLGPISNKNQLSISGT